MSKSFKLITADIEIPHDQPNIFVIPAGSTHETTVLTDDYMLRVFLQQPVTPPPEATTTTPSKLVYMRAGQQIEVPDGYGVKRIGLLSRTNHSRRINGALTHSNYLNVADGDPNVYIYFMYPRTPMDVPGTIPFDMRIEDAIDAFRERMRWWSSSKICETQGWPVSHGSAYNLVNDLKEAGRVLDRLAAANVYLAPLFGYETEADQLPKAPNPQWRTKAVAVQQATAAETLAALPAASVIPTPAEVVQAQTPQIPPAETPTGITNPERGPVAIAAAAPEAGAAPSPAFPAGTSWPRLEEATTPEVDPKSDGRDWDSIYFGGVD